MKALTSGQRGRDVALLASPDTFRNIVRERVEKLRNHRFHICHAEKLAIAVVPRALCEPVARRFQSEDFGLFTEIIRDVKVRWLHAVLLVELLYEVGMSMRELWTKRITI